VLVWEAGALPAQGALIVEGLNRIVGALNRTTRAATCPLGGSDGGYTAQQVMTWLSGLPMRTRAGPAGLEHDPVRFATARLMADRAADGLLWVSSFDPTRLPPTGELPGIVLGPPGQLDPHVFLPVATPGINAPGHLFRTDIIVVVPLQAVRDDGLPGVAELITNLGARMGERMGATPT
jgi:formylmethanofuran dehydrogenase subunit B